MTTQVLVSTQLPAPKRLIMYLLALLGTSMVDGGAVGSFHN